MSKLSREEVLAKLQEVREKCEAALTSEVFHYGVGWVVQLPDGRPAWVDRNYYPLEQTITALTNDGARRELPHDTRVKVLLTPAQAAYLALREAAKPHALGKCRSISDTPRKARKA